MELYNNHGVVLTIDRSALKKMISSVKNNQSLEAGGVLLGKKKISCETYTVTDVGIPTKYDRRAPLHFIRSAVSARQQVDDAWKKSSGTVNHIGEWHSHTFASPYPSPQDRRDMVRAFLDGEYVFDHFFTIIVSNDWQIFTGLVERGKIVDYKIVKVGRELCTDTALESIAKTEENKL